ncbi:hypothetical protein [Burkholderia ubonensis]|uniref:hypothetical protein n=1 Tax=Burkholderia ubonensis TaxID=101571 RepID=UPI0012FCE3A9|nr:hypothetical protein [Burkholderia ubonensis]
MNPRTLAAEIELALVFSERGTLAVQHHVAFQFSRMSALEQHRSLICSVQFSNSPLVTSNRHDESVSNMPQRQPCCPMNVAGMSPKKRHLSAGLHRDRAATTEPDFPTVAMASAEFSNHTQIFFRPPSK